MSAFLDLSTTGNYTLAVVVRLLWFVYDMERSFTVSDCSAPSSSSPVIDLKLAITSAVVAISIVQWFSFDR